jgi:hypothetical protein
MRKIEELKINKKEKCEKIILKIQRKFSNIPAIPNTKNIDFISTIH